MTAKEALEQGFYIDRTCYPNMAYKGPRFNPTNVEFVLTGLEELLLEACKVALAEFERHSPLTCNGCSYSKTLLLCAIAKAREKKQ